MNYWHKVLNDINYGNIVKSMRSDRCSDWLKVSLFKKLQCIITLLGYMTGTEMVLISAELKGRMKKITAWEDLRIILTSTFSSLCSTKYLFPWPLS